MNPVIPLDDALFKTVLEASPSGTVIVDEQGKIVFCNGQVLRWFGYTADELIGQSVEILTPDAHQRAHVSHRARFREQNFPRMMAADKVLSARRKDGSEFPVDISLHPIETRLGWVVLANICDATLRRAAETLPLERLAAVDAMAKGLAHESRNALQRARGCLDLLELDMEDEDEPLDLTKRIRRALEDLERLYARVCNYASPIALSRTETDLGLLIVEVFNELEQVETEADVIRSLRLQSVPAAIQNRVDQGWMRQAVRCILENALAASPPAEPILVTISVVFEPWEKQRVEITDFGSGIAEDSLQHIFEPFYTTKQTGAGLGLAICRRVIEAHGGSISASSQIGQGTTIRFELPLLKPTSSV